jgi:hypothetical protein
MPGFSGLTIAPPPPVMSLDIDRQRQFYRPGVSQYRISPLPTKANPSTNASARSISSNVVAPVAEVTNANSVAISNLAAMGFQGAWSTLRSYAQGASVDFGGAIYISLINANVGNQPDISPSDWQAAGGSVSYAGVWNSGSSYTVGQTVSVSTSLYIALQNSTNKNPATTTAFWQLLSGSTVFRGAWNNATAYNVGDEVTNAGSFWVAITANTNQTPGTTSSFWTLVGTNAILIGAWSNATAYVQNQQVTFGGNVYSALQNNTNQTPPTPPTASTAFWQLIGPATIDPTTGQILAKGSLPPTQNNGFSYTSTTSSVTPAWTGSAIYRPDGSITTIPNGSQAISSLGSALTYYLYPYWDENSSSLKFIGNSDVNFPNITGVVFTGSSSQEVTTTTSHALTSAFSIEYWIKIASGSSSGGGVTVAPGQTGAISGVTALAGIRFNAGTFSAFYRDSGGSIHTANSPLTYNDGQFHHVVYTVSVAGNAQNLYVDGVQVATGTAPTAVSATTGWYRLARDFNNAFLTGTLSEVAIYATALSAIQVAAHYNAGNSISQTAFEAQVTSDGATIWWKLTDTSGTSAVDSGSIGGNTGTYVLGPSLNQSAPVFGAVGSPALAWTSRSLLVSQAQVLQSRIPMTIGGWATATTSGGTGGGAISGSTGGSGDGCFSPNTLVQTPDGNVRIDSIKVGDFVISRNGVARKVIAVFEHEDVPRDLCAMGNDEFVTQSHLIFWQRHWQPALSAFTKIYYRTGKVFNLGVDAQSFDDHSFMLANGVLAHNSKLR